MFSIARVAFRQSRAVAFRPAMFSPVSARGLATATGLLDVTQEIKIDHDNVRELFQRYKSAQTLDEKKALANTLIREMSIHGDAEEISVYNDYDKIGLTNTVQHNKEEHADVKKLIFKAEHAFTSSENYDEVMSEAVDSFLKHAEEEERNQFQTLREKLSPEDNDAIARAFLKARENVPFRPHPLTPQTGGAVQKGMGMHGKVQDKIIEKVTGREYVDLKYSHSKP